MTAHVTCPGVILEELSVAIVHLATRDSGAALAARLAGTLALDLPEGPRCSRAGSMQVLGLSPGRWLLLREPTDYDFAADLAVLLRAEAAQCDLSDAYVVYRLRGDGVRRALSKLLCIDLHERVFAAGCVAATVASHVPVIVWRPPGEADTVFELAVPRSYAASVREALEESAAEVGLQAR